MLTSRIGSTRAFLFLYTRYPTAAPIKAIPATPPTTPPAMAPTFELEPLFVGFAVVPVVWLAAPESVRPGLEVPSPLPPVALLVTVTVAVADGWLTGRLLGACVDEVWLEDEGLALPEPVLEPVLEAEDETIDWTTFQSEAVVSQYMCW